MREQQSERWSNDGQVPAPAARFSAHFTAITFASLSAYGRARTDRGETRISADRYRHRSDLPDPSSNRKISHGDNAASGMTGSFAVFVPHL